MYDSITLEKLSAAEKLVLDVSAKGKIQSDDISDIARVCNLSDFQVNVAVQLLIFKNMISSNHDRY
jgi:hypothetical protein